ncbi:MAG: hypothetical protein IK137_02860 [Bacilli bacterium]|nr:hypothetical protein [Bacilli bacterium]
MKKIISLCLLLVILLFPLTVKAENKITLYLFHGDGCPHCAEEINYLNKIKSKYKNLKIVKYEVWYNKENAEFLKQVKASFEVNSPYVPTTIIGNTIMIGYKDDTTGATIERTIKYYSENEYIDQIERIKNNKFVKEELVDHFKEEEEKTDGEMTIKVPLLGEINLKRVSLTSAAVVIGLVDGFNPCAMWILLFLISVLIGMKNKKRMLALGLTFLITSALVYMFIMLSWIQIAVKITTVIWVRNIIAVIALIGSFVNIRSYINSRKNGGCEVVNDKKRKNIFNKIKKFTSEKSFILALLGVIGLAVSVNLVELACSAGLPLVFTELLVLNNASDSMKLFYTFIYIVFFLLDDLIVFIIAMCTMKITGISTKYNKYSHLIGGIIMLLIGVLLIFKPEWLMFQFK